MRFKAGFWTVFAISAILFFAPLAVEEKVGLGLDKLVHFFLFGVMLYFVLRAYPEQKALNIVLLLVYVVLTEYIQENFIPHRHFDIFDIAADSLGIIGGSFIFWIPDLVRNDKDRT